VARQPVGHLDQQSVAVVAAEGVAEGFEALEVDNRQRKAATLVARALQVPGQPLVE
jgi:hypothetical protein